MKSVAIEAFLKSVYLDELPKAGAVRMSGPTGVKIAWGAVERFGDLMAEIDCNLPMNRYGVPIDMTAERGPSDDAILTHAAVLALDEMDIPVDPAWNPLDDMDDGDPLYRAAVVRGVGRISQVGRDGVRVLTVRPSSLIRRQAILGGTIDTTGDRPERKLVSRHGKAQWFRRVLRPVETVSGVERLVEVECDGFNQKQRIPYPDAYQKTYLDPDPADTVVARAEYEVWRSALDVLMEALGDGLEGVRLIASTAARRPWADGETKGPRILIDQVATLAMARENEFRIRERLFGRRKKNRPAA